MVGYNATAYFIDEPKYIKQEPYVGDDGIYIPCQLYVPEGTTSDYKCVLTKDLFVEAYNKWIKGEIEYEADKQISEIIDCDHEWAIIEATETTGGTDYTYCCSKCGAIRKKCFDGSVYVTCNSSDVRSWL